MPTSTQRPPLHNGHLCTTASGLTLHNGHLYITTDFCRTPSLHNRHLYTIVTSTQRPPLHHPSTSAQPPTSAQRPSLHNRHLYTMATSTQRPPEPTSAQRPPLQVDYLGNLSKLILLTRTSTIRFIRFFFSTLTVIVSILFFGLPSNQIRQQALVSYKCFVNSDFRQPVRECFESSRGSDIEVVRRRKMVRICPICGKSQKNLYTHLSRTHKLDNLQRKYWIGQEQMQKSGQRFTPYPARTQNVEDIKCDRFQLLHPFTAIVAGMTGSGKTVWVQNLLQHASRVIQPPPDRIVWSYSQWQPAYEQLQQTLPGIDFVKGIPHDLDEDSYFDPKVNNLIVIDDQMAETSNDQRILNLFTKGSHHRNLSVIFLCQNVYFQGKIMRTLSLNAAYLVLFKNPRDKLQITTLGKQMYPGKTDQFLHKYEAAVQRPYGYLFVDLKPNTPEECRLRTNVLPNDPPQTGGQLDAMKTIGNFFQRQGYLQSPLLKAMQNLEEQMDHILKDPSVPPEVKVKEYTTLFNRYLHLEQQLPNSVVVRPRQEAVLPPLADESHLPAFTTPENVPSTSLTRDSGFVTSKPPSMLQRLTSKIRIPSTSRPSTSVEVPSTPIRTHSEMGQPTSLFNTPNTPSGPPIFPPTPPPSRSC
ncbi:hypothetical protein QZH41_001101 [Actinostola sp. cb2023]|nr:hypothetical protein QZH41_001101 [Actinostola sp. cb2023]